MILKDNTSDKIFSQVRPLQRCTRKCRESQERLTFLEKQVDQRFSRPIQIFKRKYSHRIPKIQ